MLKAFLFSFKLFMIKFNKKINIYFTYKLYKNTPTCIFSLVNLFTNNFLFFNYDKIIFIYFYFGRICNYFFAFDTSSEFYKRKKEQKKTRLSKTVSL